MKKIENVSEMVVSGKKEEASVIALRLSKKSAKSYYSSSTIDDALSEAKETGAKIYEDGAYRIFLFSPALTKKNNNDLLAVKVAKKIKEVFRAHNKKFKDKIDFGIGLNNGFIISEAADSDFKFTSVGNIISSAKQISGYLDESVLLSDSIRKRVINSVKTEKVGDKEGWELKKIADRTKHEEFIKDFTKKTK
jgi:class 3 adenylate cyclase